MQNHLQFYIDGEWLDPLIPATIDVTNPATEKVFARISAGSAADVDRAVTAALGAFRSYSQWSVAERIALLEKILAEYKSRFDDIAQAMTQAMGAPISMARGAHAGAGIHAIEDAISALNDMNFESVINGSVIRYEPIGVCGLITPWNWPMHQVMAKVVPALAAGCTMILKPSEESPLDAIILAEIMDAAGLPAGVFNLVNGYGPVVGEAMSTHPQIDMMSFTGSTRGGIAVAKVSADTVKRVTQELGGKSANIILDDADIEKAVTEGVVYCMDNTGQSCDAPTRMLVPNRHLDTTVAAARAAAESIVVDDPAKGGNHLGPVVNRAQFDRIQDLIQVGIDEGATVIAGGTGRPDYLPTGFYVKPTVFAQVTRNMRIAKEEIFGPVLVIMGYDNEDEAIEIANESEYGLAGFVCSENMDHAIGVARRIRAGKIIINYDPGSSDTPFGGYKQSGNGRENGSWGIREFLEVKAITGTSSR